MELGFDPLATRDALSAALEFSDSRALCAWPLALAFNELLDAAREELGDDPVVATIPRLRPAAKPGYASADCKTVAALANQIGLALTASTRT